MERGRDGEGTVYCTNCGHQLTPGDRFCPECGTSRPNFSPRADNPPAFTTNVTTATTLGEFTGAPPMFVGTMAPAPIGISAPLLRYDVIYPERLSRLLIFVKWLLVIPHWIALYIMGIILGIVTLLAWFAILFVGRYPRGMWQFSLGIMHWQANVFAYLLLQRDEYPPFGGDDSYPVQFELDYPARLSRLLIFVKWLLILPSTFVLYLIILVASVAVFLAWFAILFTGRYPRGLFDFVTGTMRWMHRANAYLYLLTDAYPPFRMGQ